MVHARFSKVKFTHSTCETESQLPEQSAVLRTDSFLGLFLYSSLQHLEQTALRSSLSASWSFTILLKMPPLHLTLPTNPRTEHRVSWVGRPPESSYFETKHWKTQVHLLQYWCKSWESKEPTGTPGNREFSNPQMADYKHQQKLAKACFEPLHC